MQVLLRAAFHLTTLRNDNARVAVVVDADTGVGADQVFQVLHPWRPWLEVSGVLVAGNASDHGWVAAAAAIGATTLCVITERPEFRETWDASARRGGLKVIHSDYVADSERGMAFMQEMAHHHYEMGGLNEWDGTPTKYSRYVLQHISAANCVTHFPQYMTDKLRARYVVKGQPLDALDIGSGPISHLRWGALQGILEITGVDPLLDVYDLLLSYHGLDQLPEIRVARAISAGAEQLDRYVAPASADFAYCCNALDHVESPTAVVAALARALKPGACVALEFATREGSRQEWHQLHQFDLFVSDAGRLECLWRDGRGGPLIEPDVPLALEQVVSATDDYTTVVLTHTGRGSRWRAARSTLSHRK